jgi:hypothetical protein
MAEIDQPVRRIVTIDDGDGRSRRWADGPSPDVVADPARPGFISTRIWVAEAGPLDTRRVAETLSLPPSLTPPPGGSACRVVTIPPDAPARPAAAAIDAYFRAVGSPEASTAGAAAPHPYMQKTRTLDLCVILDGEVTLVLDTGEVQLAAGDTVVQRGTNHAWSNRSGRPCTIAISSHDAAP